MRQSPQAGLPMSEVTRGLRAALSYAKMYDLFTGIMGAKKGRIVFSDRYIRAKEGDRVLDIGCGTAEIRGYLPAVEYYGFDPNPDYIGAARKRLRDVPGCTLVCAALDEMRPDTLPKFDIALALGVLHHLDDGAAVQLAALARGALKPNGRFILVDPCLVKGQSPIARFLVRQDRGRHVRDESGYHALMQTAFESVKTEIRSDLIRFPYTHLIMECKSQ